MKRISLAFWFLIVGAAVAVAQPVTAIGPPVSGNCSMFASPTVIKDGGFPCPGAGGTLNLPAGTTFGGAVVLPAGSTFAGSVVLPNGSTATTQTAGDNSTRVATDAFVIANLGLTAPNFQIFAAPGAVTTLTLTATPLPTSTSFVSITFDGVTQARNTWSIVIATGVITFNAAIPINVQVVEVDWLAPQVVAGVNGLGGASGNINLGNGLSINSGTNTLNAVNIPSRQAILSSAVNANGFPAFAVPGSGLNVNLVATATPWTGAFAAGFGTPSGGIDFVGQASADVTSFWPSLPASQYSFLAIDRNVSTGALTATQTLMRPQKGPAFYAPRQALLHFENNLTDDWGNAWGSNGATFTAPCAKFGATGLRLNGSASYAQTTAIVNPGQGNWTMNIWANLDSNVNASIFSAGSGFGMLLATSASGKLLLYLSSGGVAWDTANAVAGATTVTAGTFHHFAVVFTGNSYFAYLDGVQQIVVPSSVLVWDEGVAMAVGAQVGFSSTTAGCFDEFEFLPYAKWVGAFTPPVAASAIFGDWFDSNAMVMKTATAAGPVWSTIQRMYVAEAVTTGAAVSAVYDYSSVSQYRGSTFAIDASGKVRDGNTVYLAGQSQFISFNTTIGSVVPWVLAPSLIPPDAKAFYVQFLFHSPIAPNAGGTGVAGQDCSLDVRIPVGPFGNYAEAVVNASNFKGFGTASAPDAHQEISSGLYKVPVINGIASLDTIISGTTCTSGGANAAQIIQGLVSGYEMP